MAPIVHGLETEYSDRMIFTYLDIDDTANDPFKQTLKYRVQPHFFLIDEDGAIIQQWLGRVSEDELRQAFDLALE